MNPDAEEEFLKTATLAERFAAARIGYALMLRAYPAMGAVLDMAENIASPDGWKHIAPAWLRKAREGRSQCPNQRNS